MKKPIKYIIAFVLTAFALLTLFLSTSVIFDLFEMRAKEGNYVLFVVIANFISSLLYLISIVGMLLNKKWSHLPILSSALLLILTQIAFLIYVNNGGIHETRTIGAMFFRITVTIVFTLLIYRETKKTTNN